MKTSLEKVARHFKEWPTDSDSKGEPAGYVAWYGGDCYRVGPNHRNACIGPEWDYADWREARIELGLDSPSRINAERLATDRAYWDSVAPEGATHYDKAIDRFCNAQKFYNKGKWEKWVCGGIDRADALNLSQFIPRPVAIQHQDSIQEIHELGMIAGMNVELQSDGTIYLYDGERALGTTVKNIEEAYHLLEAAKAYNDIRETYTWE